MKELHLVIDDFRDLRGDVIARTYDAGVSCLLMLQVTHLYLDHDLGPRSDGKSGYDILKFMFDHSVKTFKTKLPSFVQLVTSNPVGLQNMGNLLKDNGYHTKDGRNFINN